MFTPKLRVIELKIGRTHEPQSVKSVAKAINLGGMSNLLSMAMDRDHRQTVIDCIDDSVWQAMNCDQRGGAHEADTWWKIAKHTAWVLAASSRRYRLKYKIEGEVR